MAEQLIASMTTSFEPEKFKDDYTAKVERIIEQKIAGGDVVESLAPSEKEGGQVVNLLEALRRSVAATQRAPHRTRAAPRRKSGARPARNATRRAGARRENARPRH